MRKINVLDCTLRDGGCVNDFNFGTEYMKAILDGVEESGADIIECGYIDQNKGSTEGRTQYINEQSVIDALGLKKKSGRNYVAMIDYGKYDFSKLSYRTEESIDGIRLAFHKKNAKNIVEEGKKILEKGYDLYIQPMLTMRYSDRELLDLIEEVNLELPDAKAFYIVDSFGEMRANDLDRTMALVDHNLSKDIALGFHSHNNLQLSYSNAINLLGYPGNREIIIDVTILGMGKGAGNLNAEIFEEHLNLYYGKDYNIKPLLYVIDNVLNQIREEYHWGYSVEYYLSSINHCSPTYAGFFYDKHTLTIGELSVLLSSIKAEKRISFDREYANDLYYAFIEKSIDDNSYIERLKKQIQGSTVLLIAPGKSIGENKEKILQYLDDTKAIPISINHVWDALKCLVFCTKSSSYEDAMREKREIIVTSNVRLNEDSKPYIINISKYNKFSGKETDISSIILINLLISLGVKRISLAGFDGFSVDINSNYYDKHLNRPVNSVTANARNRILIDFFAFVKKSVEIEFVTTSLYE